MTGLPVRVLAPQEDYDFESVNLRLENWGRWAKGGIKLTASVCGSAERRYVPPRADDERVERAARVPVDVADAERVERVVASLGRAFGIAAVVKPLTMHYVDCLYPSHAARNLRMHPNDWEAMRVRLVLQVADRLRILDGMRRSVCGCGPVIRVV